MFARNVKHPKINSFFLLGPRGTGKTTWVKQTFPNALVFDLLKDATFSELLAHPDRLENLIPAGFSDWIVIDEIQKLPLLLDEVHRLIESKKYKFILTGSSARKLKRQGTNLLAGRAYVVTMHPLTATELGDQFKLDFSIRVGHLPLAYTGEDPARFQSSYIGTYLREEVQQEALVRNLASFSRFLEAASFSQGSVLNIQKVAEDCGVNRKTVTSYFELLEDLLLAVKLPVFQRRAKRKTIQHPKFYYFDCGVYRAIRPKGPLDQVEEIDGIALETLVFQELRAHNANANLGYELCYWRTIDQIEVDFVLYGEKGICAIEVKRAARFRDEDLRPLREFISEYPVAKGLLLYTGDKEYYFDQIQVVPIEKALRTLPELLARITCQNYLNDART